MNNSTCFLLPTNERTLTNTKETIRGGGFFESLTSAYNAANKKQSKGMLYGFKKSYIEAVKRQFSVMPYGDKKFFAESFEYLLYIAICEADSGNGEKFYTCGFEDCLTIKFLFKHEKKTKKVLRYCQTLWDNGEVVVKSKYINVVIELMQAGQKIDHSRFSIDQNADKKTACIFDLWHV